MLILLIALWGLIVYHHLVYPLLLNLFAKRHNSSTKRTLPESLPQICLIIPAYNEADVIAKKIRNIAALDYPKDRLKLIVACDGCTDDTAIQARKALQEPGCQGLNAELIVHQKNKGKVAVLNETISGESEGIIALSDASALISHDALKQAASYFKDARIAVVAATYHIDVPGSDGEAAYWRYQTRVKCGEAAIGSPIGVHGALYFFRRRTFRPLPADTINDDFILPMKMVEAGHRAIYAPEIVATELEQASLQLDRKRRVRIAAGNFQQLLRSPGLLSPRLKGVAFAFFSGKCLRALMPLLLLTQLLICCWLAPGSMFFSVILGLQLAGLTMARLSAWLNTEMPFKLNLICYLINGYISSFIGVMRYCMGLERGQWKSVSEEIKS